MTYHTCGDCAHGKFASKAQIGSKGTCEEKKLFVTKSSGNQCAAWCEQPKKTITDIAYIGAPGQLEVANAQMQILDEVPPMVSKEIAEALVIEVDPKVEETIKEIVGKPVQGKFNFTVAKSKDD